MTVGTISSELMGTIPGWITSAGVAAILGMVIRWQLGLKKIDVQAEQVRVNARQVDNADEADLREHWGEEMAALRQNVANLRIELHECEAECARRIGVVEARSRAVEEELWGEKKQRVAEQISLINVILSTVDAPELKSLLRTLESVRLHLVEGRKE